MLVIPGASIALLVEVVIGLQAAGVLAVSLGNQGVGRYGNSTSVDVTSVMLGRGGGLYHDAELSTVGLRYGSDGVLTIELDPLSLGTGDGSCVNLVSVAIASQELYVDSPELLPFPTHSSRYMFPRYS